MGKNQVVRIRSFRGLLETPEAHFGYDPAAPILLPTVPKVALALVPRAVIATRQTTMIRASMTAYSTAVGPSSAFKNSTTNLVNRESMTFSFLPEFRETRTTVIASKR